jgi:hypothetical protein
LDGARMSWPWALPFVGLLLSIALGPMLFPAVWHHHYGKIATAWALLTLVPFTLRDGAAAAGAAFAHVVLGNTWGSSWCCPPFTWWPAASS